jgi:hypothetical protein
MAERALTLIAVVTLLLLPASAAGQTDPPASGQVPVVVELATETIRLYPAVATAGGQLANRAADRVMDRVFGRADGRGKGAIAKRLARVYLVNLPIAALSHFAAHELGHASRLQQAGASIYDFRVSVWPWPFPIMGGSITADRLD